MQLLRVLRVYGMLSRCRCWGWLRALFWTLMPGPMAHSHSVTVGRFLNPLRLSFLTYKKNENNNYAKITAGNRTHSRYLNERDSTQGTRGYRIAGRAEGKSSRPGLQEPLPELTHQESYNL